MNQETKSVNLVTGGAGFVGSELVRQLLESGEQVIVYDNFSFGKRTNLPQSAKLIVCEGDLNDTATLENLFKTSNIKAVYHLAALHFIPYCNDHPNETIRVNVEGTENVLLMCKKYRPESLLFVSSAAVYGINDCAHKESEQPQPIDVYGATKYFGEHLVRIFHNETSIKCAVVRLFNVYGPRETNPHLIPEILIQANHGNTIQLGNLEPKRDFIHSSDVARAFRALLGANSFKFEIYNCGTGTEYSVIDIVNAINTATGKKIIIESTEDRKRKVERMHLCADPSKLIQTIGWKPEMTLMQGLSLILNS